MTSAARVHSASEEAPVSTLACAMIFGSITFATVALATRTWLIGDSRALLAAMKPTSKPLDTKSFSSIYSLLHHTTVFGLILLFAYLCENHPMYPHDDKVYDRDQFFFLIALLFLFSFYTIERNGHGQTKGSKNNSPESSALEQKLDTLKQGPTKGQGTAYKNNTNGSANHGISDDGTSLSSTVDTGTMQTTGTYIRPTETRPCDDILNRDQTEEWKGWMQSVFLLYHYYHAEEVYNSIRIMITCYVWMTGFGNFSFFYLKNDFSIVRLLQMLWRLNFLVIFLCLSQGTTYILYYICPLHTYYFLMVYATMRIGKRLNYSKYGLRIKMACVAVAIFLIWDVDSGLFRLLHFPFCGKKPVLGATNGTMWEWYFRTTLDHWSTFLGMIFAANYPIISLFYRKLEALSPTKCWLGKGIIGGALLIAFTVWLKGPFMLGKFDYNVTNPYFGLFPLITYIYFRNLTPTLRSHSLKFLHEIGKTTLETYLMQHHIWLTSNAKSLLVLIPGWPKINMMVVTLLYFMLSRKLYRLTLYLRGMVLPNNEKKCKQSLMAMGIVITAFYIVAYYLHYIGFASLKVVALISVACGLLLYQTVMDAAWSSYASSDSSDEISLADTFFSGNNFGADSEVAKYFPAVVAGMVLLILGISWHGLAVSGAGKIRPLHTGCKSMVNRGHWIPVDGCNEVARGIAFRDDGIQNFATCAPVGTGYTWGWETSRSSAQCRFTQRTTKELQKRLKHRRIAFVGDSMTRNLYHAVCRQLGIADAGFYNAGGPKHVDIQRNIEHTDVDFRWAPMAADELQVAKDLHDEATRQDASKYDLILIGGGAWDRLHKFTEPNDVAAHRGTIMELVEQMNALKKLDIPVVWATPTTINTPALNTPEKRELMTEDHMADMRKIYESLGVNDAATFVVDGPSFSKERVGESFDGVHYPPDVYSAGAQILANAFDWLLPQTEGEDKFTAPEPGKMAKPFLGLMMLCLCFIGLFFFDGFFGFSYLACLFIKGILPSDLYLEALSVLHEKAKLPPLTFNSGASMLTEYTQRTEMVPKMVKNTIQKVTQKKKEPVIRKSVKVDDEIAALLEDSGDVEMR